MQLLCIAALLLSAVSAQTPAGDEVSPTGDGIEQVEDSQLGTDNEWMTEASEEDQGTDGHWPEWAPVMDPDILVDQPFPLHGFGRRAGRPGRPRRPGRPSGGRRPNGRFPGKLDFTPTFKVDNVTFQNASNVALQEGERVFYEVKICKRGPQNPKGGRFRSQMIVEYVKLIYNGTEPNQVSVEYGVVKPNRHPGSQDMENQQDDY